MIWGEQSLLWEVTEMLVPVPRLLSAMGPVRRATTLAAAISKGGVHLRRATLRAASVSERQLKSNNGTCCRIAE
jgi:hypothetical protein